MKILKKIVIIALVMLMITGIVYAEPPNVPGPPSPSYIYEIRINRGGDYYLLHSVGEPKLNRDTKYLQAYNNEWRLMEYDETIPMWKSIPAEGTVVTTPTYQAGIIQLLNNSDVYQTNFEMKDTNGLIVNTTWSEPWIRFIQPQNLYADNVNRMEFKVDYSWVLPQGFNMSDFSIEIWGGVKGTGHLSMNDSKIAGNEIIGLVGFDRQLYPGENTVTFVLVYQGQVVGQESITVLYYEDFVDTNEDGLDDRTNQTEWIPTVPDYDSPGFNGNWLNDTIASMNVWLKGSVLWTQNVGMFISTIFSFLPAELRSGFIVIVSLMIIFACIRIVRG